MNSSVKYIIKYIIVTMATNLPVFYLKSLLILQCLVTTAKIYNNIIVRDVLLLEDKLLAIVDLLLYSDDKIHSIFLLV